MSDDHIDGARSGKLQYQWRYLDLPVRHPGGATGNLRPLGLSRPGNKKVPS